MKFYSFLLLILFYLSPVVVFSSNSAESAPRFSVSQEARSFDQLEISVAGMLVFSGEPGASEPLELVLDLGVTNRSDYQKLDMPRPFSVRLYDEYRNQYFTLGSAGGAAQGFTLYPSQRWTEQYIFQTPVVVAKSLFVVIADETSGFQTEIILPTDDIANWGCLADKPEISAEDLIIVYPRDKKIFSPGEKVYLKLDFSSQAGRPKNIHVVLPNYVLTDEQAKGQYEVVVPSDEAEGSFPIIVMAEWGEPPDSTIISKTLSLQIKG